MNPYTLLQVVFTTYIIGIVIAHSSIMEPIRYRVKRLTPKLQIVPGMPHFIECRLCLNFWISLAVVLAYGVDLTWWLPVYGMTALLGVFER